MAQRYVTFLCQQFSAQRRVQFNCYFGKRDSCYFGKRDSCYFGKRDTCYGETRRDPNTACYSSSVTLRQCIMHTTTPVASFCSSQQTGDCPCSTGSSTNSGNNSTKNNRSVIRYKNSTGESCWGLREGGGVRIASKSGAANPVLRVSVNAAYDEDGDGDIITAGGLHENHWRPWKLTATGFPAEQAAQVLPPLPVFPPPAVFGIGLNYKKHAAEVKCEVPRFPVVFMKNPSAVVADGCTVHLPTTSSAAVDYEGELAVVIGRICKNVTVDDALSYVMGYTVANDLTCRKWQGHKGGKQWCYAKSFDGFCPLGPALVLADNEEPSGWPIRTVLQKAGKKPILVQDSVTSDMIFSVRELVSFLSQDATLLPGSVILTGTPEGVGFTRSPPTRLESGDKVEVTIDGIGTLTNTFL